MYVRTIKNRAPHQQNDVGHYLKKKKKIKSTKASWKAKRRDDNIE